MYENSRSIVIDYRQVYKRIAVRHIYIFFSRVRSKLRQFYSLAALCERNTNKCFKTTLSIRTITVFRSSISWPYHNFENHTGVLKFTTKLFAFIESSISSLIIIIYSNVCSVEFSFRNGWRNIPCRVSRYKLKHAFFEYRKIVSAENRR